MRAGRGDPQADPLRGVGEIAPVADDFLGELLDVPEQIFVPTSTIDWCISRLT